MTEDEAPVETDAEAEDERQDDEPDIDEPEVDEPAADEHAADEPAEEESEETEDEALDRLAAALDEQQRRDELRWIWTAGFGLTAVATSALLLRRVGPGPAGTLGSAGLPPLTWVGIAVMSVALAVALARPTTEAVRPPLGVLGGAVVVGIAMVDPLLATGAGPSPWLALTGVLVAGFAAAGRLAALVAAGRSRS